MHKTNHAFLHHRGYNYISPKENFVIARPRDTRFLVPEKNRAAQNRTSWGLYLCTKRDFFSKNSVSARLLAKIRVSQGYCYVVQCTHLSLSGFPHFLIEEKDNKEMPQLYTILYTLFQLQAYHLNLIPLAVRVSCMSELSHKTNKQVVEFGP